MRNFVIKVADFGLSESIEMRKEYFRQDKDVAIKLPLKCLAPECLDDYIFSEKSDVVSQSKNIYWVVNHSLMIQFYMFSIISVGTWCDFLGNFQWRESPLSWCSSNSPPQNAIRRASSRETSQCCL